jgi:hypothetical protein
MIPLLEGRVPLEGEEGTEEGEGEQEELEGGGLTSEVLQLLELGGSEVCCLGNYRDLRSLVDVN